MAGRPAARSEAMTAPARAAVLPNLRRTLGTVVPAAAAVKFQPETSVPFTVTATLGGLNA